MEDARLAEFLEELLGHMRVFGEILQGIRDDIKRRTQSLESMRDELGGKIHQVSADVSVPKVDLAGLKTNAADIKPRVVRIEQHLELNSAPKASPLKRRKPRK